MNDGRRVVEYQPGIGTRHLQHLMPATWCRQVPDALCRACVRVARWLIRAYQFRGHYVGCPVQDPFLGRQPAAGRCGASHESAAGLARACQVIHPMIHGSTGDRPSVSWEDRLSAGRTACQRGGPPVSEEDRVWAGGTVCVRSPDDTRVTVLWSLRRLWGLPCFSGPAAGLARTCQVIRPESIRRGFSGRLFRAFELRLPVQVVRAGRADRHETVIESVNRLHLLQDVGPGSIHAAGAG